MQSVKKSPGLLLAFALLTAFVASARQTPSYLDKPVTVKYATLTYADLFRSLSNQTGVTFSYTNFNDSQKITVQYVKKPLRVVLNDIFADNGCTYKLKGKYIILTCGKPKPKPSTDIRLNGYIYDAVDSTLVASSSVYLRQNRQAAVTNDFGYFSIEFPKTSDVLTISVAKEAYRDTTVVILSKAQQTIVIYLQPQQRTIIRTDTSAVTITLENKLPDDAPVQRAESLSEKPRFPFLSRFGKVSANRRNIGDTLFTNFAVGLIPSISTNRLLSINTVNNYSLNLLAGYSKGINVLEVGGIANIDDGNVRWVQVGGILNSVSGNVSGLQVGGIVNYVGKDMKGVQVGGIVNINRGTVRFLQVGGIGNIVADTVFGIQVGGIFNSNSRHTEGFQIGGIYNRSLTLGGGQIAGIVNTTEKNVQGFQIAGIANRTDSIDGFQLAGIVNRARSIHGSQLAFINIDSAITGIPLGFFSYVRSGYHKLEISADERALTTIGFRSGVDRFHNIFFAGIQPVGSRKLWTYGYGLGSAIRMTDELYLSIDLTGQQVRFTETIDARLNLVIKGYLGLEWRLAKKISIAAGPTFNLLTSDTTGPDFEAIKDSFNEQSLYAQTIGTIYRKSWLGARVSLKFF